MRKSARWMCLREKYFPSIGENRHLIGENPDFIGENGGLIGENVNPIGGKSFLSAKIVSYRRNSKFISEMRRGVSPLDSFLFYL
ncbi:hypothetical protein [Bacillus alkalisoli]|uniref:hypothetical protein n=1 Tax=Bacillus alkalisoli TaxID=2011008 RepID=UPI000C24A88B|nr:hypothetical protein [Bacillus alkalisoli]